MLEEKALRGCCSARSRWQTRICTGLAGDTLRRAASLRSRDETLPQRVVCRSGPFSRMLDVNQW